MISFWLSWLKSHRFAHKHLFPPAELLSIVRSDVSTLQRSLVRRRQRIKTYSIPKLWFLCRCFVPDVCLCDFNFCYSHGNHWVNRADFCSEGFALAKLDLEVEVKGNSTASTFEMLWKAMGRIYDFSSVGMKNISREPQKGYCFPPLQISETNTKRFVL